LALVGRASLVMVVTEVIQFFLLLLQLAAAVEEIHLTEEAAALAAVAAEIMGAETAVLERVDKGRAAVKEMMTIITTAAVAAAHLEAVATRAATPEMAEPELVTLFLGH
jgi:hypothetical protein